MTVCGTLSFAACEYCCWRVITSTELPRSTTVLIVLRLAMSLPLVGEAARAAEADYFRFIRRQRANRVCDRAQAGRQLPRLYRRVAPAVGGNSARVGQLSAFRLVLRHHQDHLAGLGAAAQIDLRRRIGVEADHGANSPACILSSAFSRYSQSSRSVQLPRTHLR